MFGEKDRLQEQVAYLEQQLEEVEEVRPYLDFARNIRERHQQLLVDPDSAGIREDALETAVQMVWDAVYRQERDQLAASIYDRVAEHEIPKIKAKVEQEERDRLEADALARFEEGRPALTERLRFEARCNIEREISDEVYGTKRAALEAEVREAEAGKLRAEAEAEFDKRRDYERSVIAARVAKEIADLTPQQLREALTEEEREAALLRALARDERRVEREAAEQEEEIRVEKIVEKARTAKRIDMVDLKPGELMAVALAYRAEVTRDVVPKQQRVLYFTVVDPSAGTVLLTRDNWLAEKDPIRKSLALPDGDVFELGTKQRSGQTTILEHTIRRSLPLTLKSAGTEVVPKGVGEELEVSQVFLGGNLNTLMTTGRDEYGRQLTGPRPVDKDLFAIAANDKVAYKFLV